MFAGPYAEEKHGTSQSMCRNQSLIDNAKKCTLLL